MSFKFNRIVIAGVGGVGYWLTWALSRDLAGQIPIEVYDPDNFEGGNGFKRLPKASERKLKKVDLLKIQIPFIMGDPSPKVEAKYLWAADFETGDWKDTLVVDCTDMNRSQRQQFWDALQLAGAKGLRVSYDGLGIMTVSPGPPMFGGDDPNAGGYQRVPTLAQSFGAAGLGAQAVTYMLHTGNPLEFQVHVPIFDAESINVPAVLIEEKVAWISDEAARQQADYDRAADQLRHAAEYVND